MDFKKLASEAGTLFSRAKQVRLLIGLIGLLRPWFISIQSNEYNGSRPRPLFPSLSKNLKYKNK